MDTSININKTALITGASRGIGKAIALHFARHGYNIVLNSISRKDLLDQVEREILSIGVSCISFIGDIGEYTIAKDLYNQAQLSFGGVDILINNAGISYVGLFSDMNPDDWDKVIRSNLYSAFNCSNLCVPNMIRNHSGKIINISSIWGNIGASMEVAYSASKGGLNAFTKSLAKELAPSNIQVNAVACGAIDTSMNGFLCPDELEDLIDEIPANRLGLVEEVADLVYYLANSSSYLTGKIIGLDGGWE